MHEALAPLTAAEMEQFRANLTGAKVQDGVKERVRELAATMDQWRQEAIWNAIKRGLLPEWFTDATKQEEAKALWKEGGYHFQGSGLHWAFMQGDKVLSVFQVHVNGKQV